MWAVVFDCVNQRQHHRLRNAASARIHFRPRQVIIMPGVFGHQEFLLSYTPA